MQAIDPFLMMALDVIPSPSS